MQKSITSNNQKALLSALRQLREHSSLRQIDVALRLQVPQSFVSKYESGERRLDLLELEQVCKACGTTIDRLLALYEKNKAGAK